MKRSEINSLIQQAKDFAKSMNVHLPPFAFWSREKWETSGEKYSEIRDLLLGWDVTDFGLNDYPKTGRTLFTLRNGSHSIKNFPRTYSEKFIFIEENQAAPVHYHNQKAEDIINRGGGNVIVQVFKVSDEGTQSDESFNLSVDGITKEVNAGEIIRLSPGESVLIPSGIIHEFWSEEGTGMTLSGEIGTICDDINDNVFLSPCKRFSDIEEDERPIHYLCNEYPCAKQDKDAKIRIHSIEDATGDTIMNKSVSFSSQK